MHVSVKTLTEVHGDRAREAFGRIAVLSGAGSLGSAGFGEQVGGIDMTGYETNEAIPQENRDKIAEILAGGGLDDEEDDDEDEESASDEPPVTPIQDAEALAKKFNKDELSEFARQAGLDGNAHTNKTELAKAILATGFTIPE